MSGDLAGSGLGIPGGGVPPRVAPRVPGADVPAPRVAPRARRRQVAPVAATLLTAFVVSALAGAASGLLGASLALRDGAAGTRAVEVTGSTGEPVAAAAAAALPSVVNIDVSGPEPDGEAGGAAPKSRRDDPVLGNGSGVAFRRAPGGGTYIVTNNHVVDGAVTIVVTPVGHERVKGTLVGADPDTDIAVVRIDRGLPLIGIGDSKKLAVGALTVAIGSPYGLEHSVTSGVISALHRSLPPSAADASGTASLVDVIQTDAAINPGNSGGALVDRTGRLVGINSAIFSSSGSNDGIGFAIPVESVARVADELIASGKVRHPFLGVVGQSVTAKAARQKSLPVAEGALVLTVVEDSGADRAGVRPGDVIVRLDSTSISSMEGLIGAVRDAGVGKTVTLRAYRNGKLVTLRMTVGVKPPKV